MKKAERERQKFEEEQAKKNQNKAHKEEIKDKILSNKQNYQNKVKEDVNAFKDEQRDQKEFLQMQKQQEYIKNTSLKQMIKSQQEEAKDRKKRELMEKQNRAREQMTEKMMLEEQQRLEHEAMVAKME